MFLAGFGVALFGLGTAFGTFWFKGAFLEGMVYSTLQYHNATAIFLVACGLIGLYLTSAFEGPWYRLAAAALNYVIIITAYGAGSRGAMLVAPIGLILLIAGMPKEYRSKVFLNFLAILVPFFITAKQVLTFGAHDEGYYWGWLALGVILSVGGQFVIEKFLTFGAETRKKIIIGAGIGLTVIAVVLVIFLGEKVMPASITDRLANMDLKQANVQERFYFYRDAFKIIKDHPVFGVGRGGWKALYYSYQDFAYNSTEVHSFPLQVWVDSGIIGILSYLALWVGFIITIFKIMRRVEAPEYRAVAWTAAVAAVSVSAHSVIDFSLSLGSVAILMFALLGLVRGVERLNLEDKVQPKPFSGPLFRKIVGFSLAAVLFAVSTSFYLGQMKVREASSAEGFGDTEATVRSCEQAVKLDPINPEYWMYLSSAYSKQAYANKDIAIANEAVKSAEEAVRMDKGATDPLWNLAWIYYMSGRPSQAVETAEEAQKAMPWWQNGYEQLAGIYIAVANQYTQMGQKENARAVLTKVLDIPDRIRQQLGKLGPNERKNWVRAPMLEVNAKIMQAVDEANKMLKSL